MTDGSVTDSGAPGAPRPSAASPRFLPAGDRAMVVEFGDAIDEGLNAAVMALDARLQAMRLPGVQEAVPTYRSLMIHYDPLVLPPERLRAVAAELAALPAPVEPPPRVWHVPACYGGAHGMDLADLAAGKGMREEDVVAIHAGAEYRIFMFGFAPGYAYLGPLDPRLHTPRREAPRLMTPSQVVSVGGVQTLMSTFAMPSGWHILGRTPVRNYEPSRREPFLFAAGDAVRFEPVGHGQWDALDARAAAGEPVATCEERGAARG